MSPTKSFVALTAALGLLSFAGTAFAQTSSTCATDADCQHGYTCQVTAIIYGTTPACPPDSPCTITGAGGSTGGAAPHAGATPVPTGGSGTVPTSGGGGSAATVPAKDGGTSDPGSTTTSTISSCVPGPCTADSDCATGMICHGQTVTTCSGGSAVAPCEPGTKCDTSGVVTESQCTTETISTCAFKWELPCNADADCGAGFSCQPSIGGACSGGAPSAGVGGDTGGGTSGAGNTGGGANGSGTTGNTGTGDLPPDTCTTTMTYPGYCRSLVVTCNVDTDCPSPWICQDNTVGVGGAGGATVAPALDGGPASSSGTPSRGAADVAAPVNTKMCVAPYTPIGVKDDGAGGRTGGGSTSSPNGSGGGTTPPLGANDGSGSVSGTGGTTAGTHESSAPASADNSGGCAVIPSRGSSSAGLLVLAGLAMLAARRRRS